MVCSSNIQLKLQVENHLHTVDHGFTSFCTTLTFVHASSMRLLFFFFFPLPPPKLSAAPSKTGFTPWHHSLGRSVLTKIAVRSPFRLFFCWQKYKPLQHFCSQGFCQTQAVLCEAESMARIVGLGAERPEVCS